jgi:hypothetical protein
VTGSQPGSATANADGFPLAAGEARRLLADLLQQLGVGALDRFSQDIGALRVQREADLGAPGPAIGLVGISDFALGELCLRSLLPLIKLIKYVQRTHSLFLCVRTAGQPQTRMSVPRDSSASFLLRTVSLNTALMTSCVWLTKLADRIRAAHAAVLPLRANNERSCYK